MPTTMSIVAVVPGGKVRVQRIATMGSRTDPAELESGPGWVAPSGWVRVLPRPMKRLRSVS